MQTTQLGAIFDWDGVIIDSSSHHEESWERLAAEIPATLPEGHFKRGFGMKNEVIIPELLKWTTDVDEIARLSLRKEEIYREVVAERGLWALPGVTDLLCALREAGIPRVIGSSTHRLNIMTALDRIGLAGMFDAIVSAEDVSRGKPDPEVFLAAARKINREPSFCVVFEDAFVGIEAGQRAGMKVVAVATTNALDLLGGADIAVQALTEVNVPMLVSLVRPATLAETR
jgi:HAD superfamily hydrolase (TIGR01509 family)